MNHLPLWKEILVSYALEVYQHLHPLSEATSSFDYKIDEYSSLDIEKMVANNSELAKECC